MKVALVCTHCWDRTSPPFWTAALAASLAERTDAEPVAIDLNSRQRDIAEEAERLAPQHAFGACFCFGDPAGALLEWPGARQGADERLVSLIERSIGRAMRDFDWSGFGVVGIGVTFSTWTFALALARAVKRSFPDVVVVLGGEHATFWAVYGARYGWRRTFEWLAGAADYILVGEADRTFADLVDSVGRNGKGDDIPGVVPLTGSVPRDVPWPPLVGSLDELPVPDFSLFDFAEYEACASRSLYMELSRGCRFSCAFCSESRYWKRFRHKSAERTIREHRLLVDRYRPEYLCYTDSAVFPEAPAVAGYLRWKAAHDPIPWAGYVRVSSLEPENVELLARSRAACLIMGIESASQRVLDAMGKKSRAADVLPGVGRVASLGIDIQANLVLGYPGEDGASLDETVALLGELLPLVRHPQVFQYLPAPFSVAVEAAPDSFRGMLAERPVPGSLPVGPCVYYRPERYVDASLLEGAVRRCEAMGVTPARWTYEA